MLAAVLVFYALVPEELYRQSIVKSDISPRWTAYFRVSYLTAVFSALAWLTFLTGRPWPIYYAVLWLVPLGTSFSFCMLLRQIVQHGNAGGERFTNTRIFLVSRLIRFGVFPLGMDYHLPHHLFPMVPHYRLSAAPQPPAGSRGVPGARDDRGRLLLAPQPAATSDRAGVDGDGEDVVPAARRSGDHFPVPPG